jgi:predicted DsbA family dithiol-disulfide isomerase
MAITVPVAHDFICPWCYVALLQKKRLEAEFEVHVEWKSYELWPENLEWPESTPAPPPPANRPPVPSRLDFILYADGIQLPNVKRPSRIRSFNAHQAAEFAKSVGVGDEYIEILYRAFWERGENINELEVLKRLATGVVDDLAGLENAIQTRQFHDNVVLFDDDAYNSGIYNVPTFLVGDQRLAEQPYVVLREAVSKIAPPKSSNSA